MKYIPNLKKEVYRTDCSKPESKIQISNAGA